MGMLDLFSPCKILNCNFGQIVYKKNLILTPLKDKDGLIVYGCRITEYTITFVPIDDETPAACGVCILGKMQYFGRTLMNPKKSLVNYDVKETSQKDAWFLYALALLFIALKLTGFIGWSWWLVTAPLWGGAEIDLSYLKSLDSITL